MTTPPTAAPTTVSETPGTLDEGSAWLALKDCDLCYRAGPFSSCVHYREFIKACSQRNAMRSPPAQSGDRVSVPESDKP